MSSGQAQAHSGPNPKNDFTKARARPGWAWAWPELIPKAISVGPLLKSESDDF